MKYFKKHIITISILFSIVIIVLGNLYISRNKDDWNINIEDISGEREVLSEVNISGNIIDDTTMLDFNLEFNKSGSIVDENLDFITFSDIDDLNNIKTRASYESYASNKNTLISKEGRYSYYAIGGDYIEVRFLKGFPKKSKTLGIRIPLPEYLWTEYDVLQGSPMAYTENGFYICPSTSKGYSGNVPIYKINKFASDYYRIDNSDNYEVIETFNVTSSEQVIGMDVYDEKIYILISNENKYILKCFDLHNDEFKEDSIIDFDNEDLWISDLIFSFNNKYLSININDTYAFNFLIANNEFEYEGLVFLSSIEYPRGNRNITYIDNYLYVLDTDYIFPDIRYNYQSMPALSTAKISVLDTEGKIIYQGNIKTDVSDDFIRFEEYNERLVRSSDPDNMIQYRRYYNFEVTKKES